MPPPSMRPMPSLQVGVQSLAMAPNVVTVTTIAYPKEIHALMLQTPWEPMLTAEEVQRALGYYGSGSRMRRVAAKLLAGQPIKVG